MINENYIPYGTDYLRENFNFHNIFEQGNDNEQNIDIYDDIDLSSKYYDPETFCSEFKENKNLSVLSLNVQSLSAKFSSLLDLISFWKQKGVIFDIICLQETFNIPVPSLFSIPNYHDIIYKTRSNFAGGGVAIFVHSSLKFSILNEYSIFKEKIIESLFIEIEFYNKKKIILGNVYRSPSQGLGEISTTDQMNIFLEHMQGIIDSIGESNKKAVLVGDFNLNLLNYNSHNITKEFANMLFSAGFLQLISNPTRVGSHNNSISLIDHIWSNDIRDHMLSGIITTYLSDHFATFHFIGTNKHSTPPKTISSRVFSDINIENFKQELNNLSFNEVYEKVDSQNSYDAFHDIFHRSLEQHFPIKTIKFNKNKHMIEKWMTNGILKCRKKKFQLQKVFAKNPTPLNKAMFINYKNTYNRVLKTRRKLYYSELLISYQGNLKKTWQTIKEASGLSSNKNAFTDSLNINEINISGNEHMSKEFNFHFTNIAANIKESINPTDKPPDSYLNECRSSFQMPNITPEIIYAIVKDFEDKKSVDLYGISPFLIKRIISSIVNPLCYIFNKSLESGVVPDQFKLAKVTPVFKKGGDPTNPTDYRPISLLMIFSKIIEKFVAFNLKSYLFDNNIINQFQFGFQEGHSTYHPMIHLLNSISEAMNNKEYTIGIFCDLQKAFDCVPKRTLILKLKKYGITGISLKWFESYLSNRKQFVRIGNHDSEMINISSGVPQGSILGPILFLLFFNDLPNSTLLKILLFCDDTTILASGKNLNELIEVVNFELQKISQWFRANDMSLHPSKTKFTVFYPTPSLIPWNDINLYFDENEPNTPDPNPQLRKKIGFVNHESNEPAIKFLGIYLDPGLNFKFHIDQLNKKLSKSLFCIRRSKNILTESALKTLYYSTFHCHLIYGILIYTCAYQSNLNSLIIKQKKAIRCITNSQYNAHTGPLFKKQKILPFESLILFFRLKFMFEYKNNLMPRSFANVWQYRGNLNGNHLLRNNSEFNIPRFRITLVEKLPLCSFPATWNNYIDIDNVKNASNKNQFVSKLKKSLLNQIPLACNRIGCPVCAR